MAQSGSPETSHNVLSPFPSSFCIYWHLWKDLIYLFMFPSPLFITAGVWGLAGISGVILGISAGEVGVGDSHTHFGYWFFFHGVLSGICVQSPVLDL